MMSMSWIARDLNGRLCRYERKPVRGKFLWNQMDDGFTILDRNDDAVLIGRHIGWRDEPVEI